jgi:hypothetical protein
MTKFKTSGAVCLAIALAAASPAMARSFHGRVIHGAGFHGSGVIPGIAAGVTAGAVVGGPSGYYGHPGAPGYYGHLYASNYDNGDVFYENGYWYSDAPAKYSRDDPSPEFVCRPGTLFRGDDGRRHLCQ